MAFIQDKINTIRMKLSDKGLYDRRLLALVVVGFVSVSVFWNGAQIVQQNFELAQKAAEIQEQNEILELENRNKELQNEFLKTDEFAELTARRVFGRAAPGERVYIVPRDVALNSLSSVAVEQEQAPEVSKPAWQRNIEAWLSIYLGS